MQLELRKSILRIGFLLNHNEPREHISIGPAVTVSTQLIEEEQP